MAIETHCPNPKCARLHRVKDRYAGMRGKCPRCGSWMYVPKLAAPVEQVTPSESKRSPVKQETPPVATPVGRIQQPAGTFSRAAAVLMLLGVLGLGLVGATPYLPKPSSGGMKVMVGNDPRGIEGQSAVYVTAAPVCVAVVVILSLALMPFALVSRVLLCLATLASAAFLFLALTTFRQEIGRAHV